MALETAFAVAPSAQACLLTRPIWYPLPAGHHQLPFTSQPWVITFPSGSRMFSLPQGLAGSGLGDSALGTYLHITIALCRRS